MTEGSPENKTINISVLILAGGKSSRMGRDKALVCYQGKPMLLRVYEVAIALMNRVYILVPSLSSQRDNPYKKILPECNYLIESQPYRGALYGLYEGLKQISPDDSTTSNNWILLLACDLPLLDKKIIQEWINNLEQIPQDIIAVVPKNSSYWEPMCGFYRYSAIAKLEEFLQSGGRSFQKWFSTIKIQALPVTTEIEKMLHNCNTPKDLEKTEEGGSE